MLAADTPKTLFADETLIRRSGLDIPFTAKLTALLREKGVVIPSDFTTDSFVKNTLRYVSTALSEGECHA